MEIEQTDITSDEFQHLVDYLSGECTTEEAMRVEQWLAEAPERQSVARSLTRARGVFGRTQFVDVVESRRLAQGAIDRIVIQSKSLGGDGNYRPQIGQRRGWQYLTRGTGLIAAMCLLFMAVVWRVFPHLETQSAQQSVSSGFFTYSTGNAQQATVTLPDGSSVFLNVASRLEVPLDYSTGNRTLQLNGEALFESKHRADHPFTVIAGHSVTRVLGTTFSVRQYDTDSVATVAVQEGKVAVGTTVLTAAQQVQVSVQGNSRVHSTIAGQFSFSNDVLTIPLMPLVRAAVELQRWYNVTIVFADPSLGEEQIKGQFTAKSVTDLVEQLEWTFQLRVVRHGDILTLYRR